jgi:hypothetical protein
MRQGVLAPSAAAGQRPPGAQIVDTQERSIHVSTETVPVGNGSGPRVVRGEDIDPRYAGMDIVESEADVDYQKLTPRPISASRLREAAPPKTWLMKLHQTSIERGEPTYAEVRIVNLTDKALLGSMPTGVRKLVERLFFAGEANQRGAKNKVAENRMRQGLRRLEEIGHAYAVAGFVEPRMVLTQEEAEADPDAIWVGSDLIKLHDMTEFSRICEGDDQLAERRLEGFSRE